MLRILLIVLAIVLLPLAASAETIYLKNGKVIKAKITKDTGYSIQIMQGNFPQSFRMDEIDRIEKDGDQQAQGPEDPMRAGEKEVLTKEKKELISRLMEATGARESMSQTFQQIIDKAPAEVKDKYRELFNVDEIIARLVPIYAKYYTTQELQAIINFYKSPAGEKHIHATPVVMQESLIETIKYFQEKMPKGNKTQPIK